MNTEKRKSLSRGPKIKPEEVVELKVEVAKSYASLYKTAVSDAKSTNIDVVGEVRDYVEFAILKSAREVKEALAKQNGNALRTD